MLICPHCGRHEFHIEDSAPGAGVPPAAEEIRGGSLECRSCHSRYGIDDGIVNLLDKPSADVARQRKITIDADRDSRHEGGGFEINRENVERYREQFLTLPEGDGSDFYTHGAFHNISGLAARYYGFIRKLGLTGSETLLEIGADSCWSVAKFARMGCDCVALDINHHLMVADLFMEEYGIYFERCLADMSRLPFRRATFDVVFCSQVLHHSTDLVKTLVEISRVLKPGGRLAIFSEPMYGMLFAWRKFFFGREARKLGIIERIYGIDEWLESIREAGLSPNLYYSLHPRYQGVEKYLAVFKSRRVQDFLLKKYLYPCLVLEPYQADIIAVKPSREP